MTLDELREQCRNPPPTFASINAFINEVMGVNKMKPHEKALTDLYLNSRYPINVKYSNFRSTDTLRSRITRLTA